VPCAHAEAALRAARRCRTPSPDVELRAVTARWHNAKLNESLYVRLHGPLTANDKHQPSLDTADSEPATSYRRRNHAAADEVVFMVLPETAKRKARPLTVPAAPQRSLVLLSGRVPIGISVLRLGSRVPACARIAR
jgi:hypothetical protein